MTRFARAKGSKASNERVPEESTPWHVLKQQLESSVNNEKEQKPKPKSAKELLREKEDSLYYPSLDNANTDWAEFEDVKKVPKSKRVSPDDASPKKKVKTEKASVDTKKDDSIEKSNGFSTNQENDHHQNQINMKKKKRAEKRKKKNSGDDNVNANSVDKSIDKDTVSQDQSEKPSMKLSKRQKRNRKNKNKTSNNIKQDNAGENKEDNNETKGLFNIEGNDWKNNLKFGKGDKSPEENEAKDNTDDKQSVPTDQAFKKKSFDKNSRNNLRQNNFKSNRNNFSNNKFNNNTNMINKRKPPKIRDDKEHKRRKPDPGATKVIINGLEIEIVLYDGFPVKKEDADRLKELREKMVMKGIPKSDIDAAMKLERRKAEKALARVRKNVCFHCRKAGHVLSDCPELGREEVATGICFKCGSTEHTHFECKVNKKEEFRYATCFICREQGHISKQCPDNPKGLYPQGGACKICGDVTHLKKDCPDLTKEKEENILTLDTIKDNAVESLNGAEEMKKPEAISKTKNKVVKF